VGDAPYRYRVIDTSGSELGIVEDHRPAIGVGDSITVPDAGGSGSGIVVDVYDDEEHGREGGVVATLAVDVD
jgi:hypothetical protein